MLAASKGHLKCLMLLIEKGANLEATDNVGGGKGGETGGTDGVMLVRVW